MENTAIFSKLKTQTENPLSKIAQSLSSNIRTLGLWQAILKSWLLFTLHLISCRRSLQKPFDEAQKKKSRKPLDSGSESDLYLSPEKESINLSQSPSVSDDSIRRSAKPKPNRKNPFTDNDNSSEAETEVVAEPEPKPKKKSQKIIHDDSSEAETEVAVETKSRSQRERKAPKKFTPSAYESKPKKTDPKSKSSKDTTKKRDTKKKDSKVKSSITAFFMKDSVLGKHRDLFDSDDNDDDDLYN